MKQNIGDIKITNMIWLQTILTFGGLLFCYFNSTHNGIPTILDITKIYPNSVVFRICMLYSLFILFLQILFIKWWLNSVHVKCYGVESKIPFGWLGLFSVVSYGIFVACVDNAHMSFILIGVSDTGAFLGFCTLITLFTYHIKKLRATHKTFITNRSWAYKRTITIINLGVFAVGIAMYSGFIDINYKAYLEWGVLINTAWYFWTFVFDFKKFSLGIEDTKYDERPVVYEQA